MNILLWNELKSKAGKTVIEITEFFGICFKAETIKHSLKFLKLQLCT